LDHKLNEFVAIKVLRRTHTSKNQGLNEYKFSCLLNSSSQSSCIVQVKRKFEFRFHFFLVFELLGSTLREFIQMNSFQGIPSTLVKRLTSQLLLALSHMHSLHIIHCDLKPDNIAFKHSNKSSIRVFDFGSSCLETNTIFTYIQSRYYRAPEIVLQCGRYNTAIDMWSLGCVVAEMLLGEPLFKGKNEQELIKSMVKILGNPPEALVAKAKAKNLLVNCKDGSKLSFYFAKFGTGVIEFLQGCFKWNPNERMTAKEGIKAKWFLVKQAKPGQKINTSRF
jgi:dual specificity tyrosine-phosphorylation-regulated kinase 2/3/4